MLTNSERQTIQEVLDACRIHAKAVKTELRDRARNDPNRLMDPFRNLFSDIAQGLDISISKLETVLACRN